MTHTLTRPAGRQLAVLTLTLASLTAFAPFATDMYLAAFPAMAADFGTDVGQVQFSLSVFFLGMAVGQLFAGPLIDRFGRRVPLLCGVAGFSVVSLAIAFAGSIDSFILLRFAEAVFGCAGMLVARAVISDLFPETEAARVLSLLMMVQGLAPILAPIIGSYLLIFGGWRTIFVALAIFGCACWVAAFRVIPETLPPEARRHESPAGVLVSYARLLARRSFLVPSLTAAFCFAALFSFIAGSPFVYMEIHGVAEEHYGWFFGLNAFGMILAANVNRLLLRRITPHAALGGAVVFGAVMGLVLLLWSATAPFAVLVATLFLCLATVPLVAANATAIAMAASAAHKGSASALIGVMQFAMAALASGLVSLLHDGSVWPMAGVISASMIAALATFWLGGGRRA